VERLQNRHSFPRLLAVSPLTRLATNGRDAKFLTIEETVDEYRCRCAVSASSPAGIHFPPQAR